MNLDALKEIILDYQALTLDTGIPRRLNVAVLPGKATICIGVRRSGKSTYMFQLMHELLENGTPRENILYLNFFDDRLHNLSRDGIGSVTEAYFALYPEKKNTETVYCFFDEIQAIDGWEPFVDRLMRTENCMVYITGSSARMLSQEIATQMRGRALSWEIFPFSFREFLDFKGISVDMPITGKQRLMTQKIFDEYWKTGGFPEVAGVDRHLRIKIHQEYFNAVLFRDLVERHDASHPRAIADLAHRLVDNTASMYSINALTGYLKSLNHKIPKYAVSDALSWFEDAYFLFTVRLFDASSARANANPKKIYCVDHAMVTSVASGVLVNAGHLLENLVFTALRTATPTIRYYRTHSGREVDFIATGQQGSRILVQVCESLVVPDTRKREVGALTEAMAEQHLDSGIIVTRNEEANIATGQGNIAVLPAWKFLLTVQRYIT